MQIQLEPLDNHSIQSYDQHHVMILGQKYHNSLLITPEQIISPWPAYHLDELTLKDFDLILNDPPEIILVGHAESQTKRPYTLIQELSLRRIGIELSDIGAACRTFNVLINENRRVSLALMLIPQP